MEYVASGTFRDVFGGIAGFVSERFGELAGTIGDTFGAAMDMLLSGNLEAAWGTIVDGLSLVWSQFVDTLADAWDSFSGFFVEAWIGATTAVQQTWLELQKSIATGILDLASQSGILGDMLDAVLGVDVSGEKTRGENLERKRKELLARTGQEYIPQADSFTASREAMRAGFDARIAGAGDAVGAALSERARAKAAQDAKRRAEIDARRAALAKRLADVETKAAEERTKAAKEATTATTAAKAEQRSKTDSLISDVSGAGVVPPKLSQGLERGTAEAIQQFQENRFNNSELAKMLAESTKQTSLLEDIAENTGGDDEEGV